MSEKLDPHVRQALELLKPVPPRDPQRAWQGRAAFLAEAERLAAAQRDSSQAVSFAPWVRLKRWIQRKVAFQSQRPRRKEGFAMPGLVLAVVAALSLIFGGGALTVQAADVAVPGDLLYPVDLAVENVQLTLTTSPERQAQLRLQFAQERLQEIQTLVQQGKVDQVDVALQNMEAHLAMAAQLAAQVAYEGHPEVARQVEQMVAQSAEALQQVMQQAPEPAQEVLQQALSLATQVQEQVSQMEKAGGAGAFHLEGLVEALGDGTLTVKGVTVQVAPGTVMPQGGAQVGDFVEVEGLVDPTTGAWVALEVKVNPEGQGEGRQVLTFEGVVESVAQGEIVVGGQTLLLTDATRIKGDLQVGSVVEVRAYLDPNGSLVVEKVEVKGTEMAQGTPGAEMRFSGVVSSVDANQIVVNGQTILLDASTEIEGNLQVGSLVEVKAYLTADGAYVAKKVEVKDDEVVQGTPGAEMKFSGVVSSVDANQIVVNGQTILLDASTKIEGNLQVGSLVEVKAYLTADGAYVAKKVEVKGIGGGDGDQDGEEITPTPPPGQDEVTPTPGPTDAGGHHGDGNEDGEDD